MKRSDQPDATAKLEQGAHARCTRLNGRRSSGHSPQSFRLPKVLVQADEPMWPAREEPFRTVVLLVGFSSEADAIKVASATSIGLEAYNLPHDLTLTFLVTEAPEGGFREIIPFSPHQKKPPGFLPRAFGRLLVC